MRDEQGPERHAGDTAKQKWPDQPEVDGSPYRRQSRGLRDDGADEYEGHDDRRRQHVEPDPERHQRGSEPGEAGYKTAGKRAE